MWLKLCGSAILCAVAVVLIKSVKGEALPLQWTATILFGGATLLLWQPVLTFLGELCQGYGMGEWAALLFKGLGIAVLSQFCADLCRQTGENMLANGVEGAGRAELLLLCLPLLKELIGTAGTLLGALPS